MTQPSLTRRTWGPSVTKDGRVAFRLWAPAEKTVTLITGGKEIAMQAAGGGWHEAETMLAGPGDPYAFRLSDGQIIPDPASQAQQDGLDGPSVIVDHAAYRWENPHWKGRPWEEAVVYEMHVGTFTPEGTFRAAIDRLAHLGDLGITAIEIMPVAHFAGRRGWGYDGALLYAPHNAYGTPDDLKALVDAAHGHGIMVLLDVVYNHFGPVGNVLPSIAPAFFHPERHTPWGAALAFEQETVRRFFIENALGWILDYRFDGLRVDAVDEIEDESDHHLLIELARTIRSAAPDREIHLVVEDRMSRKSILNRDGGEVHYYTAGWNDEFHHAVHVIATGERQGHYAAFVENPYEALRESATRGFVGADRSKDRTGPAPQDGLPPQVHVNFLHNHDQIGNRAFGERLPALADRALLNVLTALLLLLPSVPLLFMGEEYDEERPFLFFADFDGGLAEAVRRGRRKEAEKFSALAQDGALEELPDPIAEETFLRSKLDWSRADSPAGRARMALIRELIGLRRKHIVPLLAGPGVAEPRILPAEDGVLAVDWHFPQATLAVRGNLKDEARTWPAARGETIFSLPGGAAQGPSFLVAIDRHAGTKQPFIGS